MLDIERRPDVDAGGQQFVDILPALGMAAAGHVGVGKFVDQQQVRTARQRGVEIELLHDLVAIDDRLARQHLEAVDQLLGFAPSVRFDQADNDIAAARFVRAGGAEHGVGFSDAGSGAEKNLQMSAPFLSGQGEERVGRSSLRCVGGHSASSRGGNLRLQIVEREIELEHIDARLAEQAERAAFDLAFDQRADAGFRQVARLGDARHLKQRRLRRYIADRARCRTSSPDRPGPARTGSPS